MNNFFRTIDQGDLRDNFDDAIAIRTARGGVTFNRSRILQLRQGISFSPEQSYRFLRFKLFDDVDLVLSGDSLENLGENSFFYSAEINGGEGRIRLSILIYAIGSINHLGKYYEIKMHGNNNYM